MFKLECAKNIERDVLNLGLHCEGINLVREYQTVRLFTEYVGWNSETSGHKIKCTFQSKCLSI